MEAPRRAATQAAATGIARASSESFSSFPTRGIRGYHVPMAVAVKKLDVRVGDVVQVGERRYDVVPDTDGGVALEPAITKTIDELHAERGCRPLTTGEFDEYFGDLPTDGEG